MKKILLLSFLCATLQPVMAQGEIEVTPDEAKTLYTNTSKNSVSVHDPSVVYNPSSKRFYIFGSHQAWAWTSDFKTWTWLNSTKWSPNDIYTAFTTNQTKTVTVGGVSRTFGNFDAQEWACAYGDWNIGGNLWAPCVIYNKKMKKWCQYLSVNGPNYNSVIILLTASNIEGPYTYQGPVVYSGFYNKDIAALSYKKMDLELAIGTQASLPARYDIGHAGWGPQWLNCIDPCVFYDTDDNLYMVYGSWFGGLYILELNEETGLRDYDVVYGTDYNELHQACTVDSYFGRKVSGGFWASGEGPFIERIGNYYYLFQSNGGLESTGGYQMRIFRSENPMGPYKDSMSRPAILPAYEMNYGTNPSTRGEKILGQYDKWGFMTQGEVAQGHNSIIAAPDGRTYLVYHTRFNTGGEGHLVKTHQVFLNEDNWLVAAPFEYNGEQITDADIASTQYFDEEDVAGTYNILIHKYGIDHANLEVVTPVKITLNESGKVTGAYTGTWSLVPGTSYFHITLGGTLYKGVIFEEEMDGVSVHSISFTAMASSGVNIWGYKYHPKYAVAWQLKNQTSPIQNHQGILNSVDLMSVSAGVDNVKLEWESDHPDILSNTGQYNPAGMTENTLVNLTLRISSGKYYCTDTYEVNVHAATMPDGDFYSNMLAYYNFDETPIYNTLNETERAVLARSGSGTRPTLEEGYVRSGKIVHINAGTHGNESYVRINNPLYQQTIGEGITVAFWLKLSEEDLVNPILAFQQGSKRFYLTGNSHVAFTDGGTNSFDINHPDKLQPGFFTPKVWTFVTLVISRDEGVRLYLNGSRKTLRNFSGQMGETTVTRMANYDYNLVVDQLPLCQYITLGSGSLTAGSPDASYDDFFVFDRVLSMDDVMALRTMANRVYDFTQIPTSMNAVEGVSEVRDQNVYDLQGRLMGTSLNGVGRGIYIYRGKKILVK